MTQEEVIALALTTAQQQGWPEKLRVGLTGGRKYVVFGPYLWWVSLISMRQNLSAQVTIKDSTGEVIDISSRPWKAHRGAKSPDGEERNKSDGDS